MAESAVNNFGDKMIRAYVSKLEGGEDLEFEMNLEVKVKTALGTRGFYFQTEKLDEEKESKTTAVKMKAAIENKLVKLKKKIEYGDEYVSSDGEDSQRVVWSVKTPKVKKPTKPTATSTSSDKSPEGGTEELDMNSNLAEPSPSTSAGKEDPPPAVTITPVNKKRAPHKRSSGNPHVAVARRKIMEESESSEETDTEEVPDAALLPAKRISKSTTGKRGTGARRGSRGGRGGTAGATALRPKFLDAKPRKKRNRF